MLNDPTKQVRSLIAQLRQRVALVQVDLSHQHEATQATLAEQRKRATDELISMQIQKAIQLAERRARMRILETTATYLEEIRVLRDQLFHQTQPSTQEKLSKQLAERERIASIDTLMIPLTEGIQATHTARSQQSRQGGEEIKPR